MGTGTQDTATASGISSGQHAAIDHSAVTGVPAVGMTSAQHAAADHTGLTGILQGLLVGSGVPGSGLGSDGNFFFRTDGGIGTHIYVKAAGTWAGLV